MTAWVPDAVDLIEGRPAPRIVKSCNLHADCDAEDAKRKVATGSRASHCWTEDCEDCYGQ